MDKTKDNICYSCGCSESILLHSGVRDSRLIDVLKCKKCGLLYLSTFEHIDNDFYQDGGMIANLSLEKWIENTNVDDTRRYNMLKSRINDKVVLDFGCGNAGFLNKIKTLSKRSYGVEVQRTFQDYFKHCGLCVFDSIDDMPENVDIITMFHVLEHLKNPSEVLKTLGLYLNDSGRIILEVPNSNDALLSLYKCKAFSDFVFWSCHLFVYNENSLKKIIQKAGYKVSKIEYVQRYSFMNHMHWIFKQRPAGHVVWNKFDFKLLNYFYKTFLKIFRITDSIVIEITK